MWKAFLVLFSAAFIFGQFARMPLAPSVTLLGMDALAIVTSVYWLYTALRREKFSTSRLIFPVFLFASACLVSLLANLYWVGFDKMLIGSLYLIRFLSYFGVYLFIRERSVKEKNQLKNTLFYLTALIVLIGFFQIVYYPNLANLIYLGWDDHLYRLFSVFLDPNFTGVIFVLFLIYLVYYFFNFKKKQTYFRLVTAAAAAATFLAVFLTYSRTALVTLIFGGVFYLGLLKKKGLILAFALIVFLFFISTINPDIEGLNPFRTVSTNARINSYQIALNIISRHPVTGVGFNTYRYAQNMYGYRVGGAWETSHADAGTDNSFLLVLATTGIVGFSAFVYLCVRVLKLVRDRIEKGSSLARYTLVSIIAIFISSFFVNALLYPFVLAWLWVLIALTEEKT